MSPFRTGLFRTSTLACASAVSIGVGGPTWAQVVGVRAEQKISATAGGFGGVLSTNVQFGESQCALGDLDGDGAPLGELLPHGNDDGDVHGHRRVGEPIGGDVPGGRRANRLARVVLASCLRDGPRARPLDSASGLAL